MIQRRRVAQADGARILLHSHDSYGLGHLRRTLTIATALAERLPAAQVLITSGSPCATHFALPEGVDVVKLPSVTKDALGALTPRARRGSLAALLRLRSGLLLEVVRSFRPELLIADHQPLGLSGELAPALHAARALGTRTILGLRDIIDEPAAVAREWGAREVREALAEAYERVLVYGSPEVFDPRREYSIPPELAERLEFTGYVVRDPAPRAVRPLPALRPQVLVTAGGGEDGVERIELYLDALALAPAAWDSSLVLGPLMDPLAARALQRRARSCVSVQVHRFHADLPRLLQDCDAVVSMAGYNSVAEILQCRASAVLLPRRFPRREQLLRAERLAARGLVRTLAQPSAGALRETLEAALAEGPPRAPRPQLDGREQVVRIGCELLEREPAAVSLPGAARR